MNTRHHFQFILVTVLLLISESLITVSGQTRKTVTPKRRVTTQKRMPQTRKATVNHTIKVTSIVAPSNIEINVGDIAPIKISIEPENASNKNYQWQCDNLDLLKIDKDRGFITGLKPGYANIRFIAEDGSGISTICRIKINAIVEEVKEEEIVDYNKLDEPPSFSGGQVAFQAYMVDNFKYPAVARENGVQGRVIVSFVVETDGSISDVKIARAADPSLDHAAWTLVKNMPKWKPGKVNGKAVRARMTIPVVFRLN